MLISAFIYPFFGKKNYYCNNICPCGALQELLSKITKKKWKIKASTIKRLGQFRRILWLSLSILMLCGIFFQWIDYEIFSAFILSSASVIVLIQAVIVIIFSIFIVNPYCRFICPTGTLFKIAQNTK